MDAGEAGALLRTLEADPVALAELRRHYGGAADPLDVLRWIADPDAHDHPARQLPALERVVYARAATPEQLAARDAATARLAALNAGIPRDRAALEEAVRRSRVEPAVPAAPRYRWVVPALVATSVLTAALIGWLLWAPVAGPRAESASPTPTAAETLPPPELSIVTPAGDFPAPPEDRPLGAPEGEVVEAWGLGAHDGRAVYGYTTTAQQVCIAVEADGVGGRSGRCVYASAFMRDGITFDSGAWSVSWFADGTVLWG